jgi:quinol monooxygenase YgiN
MTSPFVFIATSPIKPDHLEQERLNTPVLMRSIQANEPSLISFHVFVNDAGTVVSTVQVYADATAMEFHMTVSAPHLAEAYSQTRGAATSIQVFGEPTAGIEDMLARLAADGCRVEIVRASLGGFTRSPAPT